MASIGERILNLRKNLNLSQKELAQKVGITEASLSRYENNLREPKAEIIAKISETLGCSTDYLLGLTNNKVTYTPESSAIINKTRYKTYEEIESTMIEKFIKENIIKENETIPKYLVENTLKYGMDAAIKIYKLEKELEK